MMTREAPQSKKTKFIEFAAIVVMLVLFAPYLYYAFFEHSVQGAVIRGVIGENNKPGISEDKLSDLFVKEKR